MIYLFFFEILIIYLTISICSKNSNIITKFIPAIDYPNKRKLHKKPTPLIGGIILILIIILSLLFNYLFFNSEIYYEILVISLIAFVLGLVDDIRDLSPYLKLSTLFMIIFFFLYLNNQYIIKDIYLMTIDRTFYLKDISIFFTILCLLLLINSSNMTDGISGLFLGIYIIFFSYLEISNLGINIFNFSIIISLIFLLYFNFRNYFFMGDSGVFLLTILFAFQLINSYYSPNNSINSIEEIFILLMLPGIDMFRIFLERLINRKNPFKPDRNHFHHILQTKISNIKLLIFYFGLILFPLILFKLNILQPYKIIILFSFIYLFILFYFKNKIKNL